MKRQKGFTLIELMIVVAIIAILAALIVPNLMQNRIQANETSALGSLRTYASSQFTFQRGKFSQIPNNASVETPGYYTDNFSNLFYGANVDSAGGAAAGTLQLISKTFADARRDGNNSATSDGGVAQAATDIAPYQGYLFGEDSEWIDMYDDADAPAGGTNFGLIAYPSGFATTGYNCFWVGVQGIILQQNKGGTNGQPADEYAGDTPYPTGTNAAWVVAG